MIPRDLLVSDETERESGCSLQAQKNTSLLTT
jgi:hypothetical protein